MKTKKSPLFGASLAVLASFTLAQSATAAFVVAGWYDFDGTTSQQAPDVAIDAVTNNGTFAETTSVGLGGDFGGDINDNTGAPPFTSFYGNSSVPTGSDGNDGFLQATSSGAVNLSVRNTSNTSIPLHHLFFDAAQCCPETFFSILLSKNNANVGFAGFPAGTAIVTGDPTINAVDYTDLSVSLIGITLNPGDTFGVQFVPTNNDDTQRSNLFLDNIAITAIPEPGNFLAIGLLIGSGLMLRVRPRRKLV